MAKTENNEKLYHRVIEGKRRRKERDDTIFEQNQLDRIAVEGMLPRTSHGDLAAAVDADT